MIDQRSFILPLPPSVNSCYGGGSGQQRFKSSAYKVWENSFRPLTGQMRGTVKVSYTFFFPDNRARDLSNYIKAVDDRLVRDGVIEDDSWQVLRGFTCEFGGIDKQHPRVEVIITPQI